MGNEKWEMRNGKRGNEMATLGTTTQMVSCKTGQQSMQSSSSIC